MQDELIVKFELELATKQQLEFLEQAKSGGCSLLGCEYVTLSLESKVSFCSGKYRNYTTIRLIEGTFYG